MIIAACTFFISGCTVSMLRSQDTQADTDKFTHGLLMSRSQICSLLHYRMRGWCQYQCDTDQVAVKISGTYQSLKQKNKSQLRCVFAWVCFFSICLRSIWMTLIFFSSHQFCFIYLWKNAFLWTRISWISWLRLFNTRHGDNFTWRGKLDLCKNTCFWIITRIAVFQV